jgi:hypothetical protein
MTDRPRPPVTRVQLRASGRSRRWALRDPRLVAGALVDVTRTAFRSRQECGSACAENATRACAALGTRGRFLGEGHRPLLVEATVFVALEFVQGHLGLQLGLAKARHRTSSAARLESLDYVTTAKSLPGGTDSVGPAALGVMSKSKISVGMAKVAHAFGMSTMPLIRPSTGAVPKMA